MHPFFQLFGLQIPAYGLLATTGGLAALGVALLGRKKQGVQAEDLIYAASFILIGALCGAKLLYLLTNLPRLIASGGWLQSLISGGFVFYGGAIGGAVGLLIYARAFRLPFLALAETIVPGIPLGHAIGRIGCLCAGCCYGLPAAPPFGWDFSASLIVHPHRFLFPIQLVEAAGLLVLFTVLTLYARRPRKKGRITGLYLMGYALLRFCIECFRGDIQRGGFAGLSTSQWISGVMLAAGFVFFFYRARGAHKPPIAR